MKKAEAINTFNKGMVMDLHPLVTPNDTLTNCLNGTLITFNGNENVLQNDMGNGKVDSAQLPEGYIPVGTAELGGIIYIASYNPLTNKSQIGSFPSPERNISSEEADTIPKVLNIEDFCNGEMIIYRNNHVPVLQTKSIILKLTEVSLNPGDKYVIYINSTDGKTLASNYLSGVNKQSSNFSVYRNPKYLKFNIGTVSDSGSITYFDSNLVWYSTTDGKYYLNSETYDKDSMLPDVRNGIEPNYDIFNSKQSGNLILNAQLECITNFTMSYDIVKEDAENQYTLYAFVNWQNDCSNIREDGKLINIKNKVNLYSLVCESQKGDEMEVYDPINKATITASCFQIPILYNEDKVISDTCSDNIDNITFLAPKEELTVEDVRGGKSQKWGNARFNNGEDNNMCVQLGTYTINSTDGILRTNIYPAMPFGIMNWFKQEVIIDTNRIGSGDFSMDLYQYYFKSKATNISMKFTNYPKTGDQLKALTVNAYKLTQGMYDNIGSDFDQDEGFASQFSQLQNAVPIVLKTVSTPHNSIDLSFTTDKLEDYTAYVLEITTKYINTSANRFYYRILYTHEIFNDNTAVDYKTLSVNLGNIVSINNSRPTVSSVETDNSIWVKPEKQTKDSTYDINRSDTVTFESQCIIKSDNLFKASLNGRFQVDMDNTIITSEHIDAFMQGYATTIPSTSSGQISIKKKEFQPQSQTKGTVSLKIDHTDTYIASVDQDINFENYNLVQGITDMDVYFLGVSSYDKNIDLYVCSGYSASSVIGSYDHWGNNSEATGTITSGVFSNVESTLKSLLNDKVFKIIPLVFTIIDGSKIGDNTFVTAWLKSGVSRGSFTKTKDHNGYIHGYYKGWIDATTDVCKDNNFYSNCFLLYAGLNESGKVTFFAPGSFVKNEGNWEWKGFITARNCHVLDSGKIDNDLANITDEFKSYLQNLYTVTGTTNEKLWVPSWVYGINKMTYTIIPKYSYTIDVTVNGIQFDNTKETISNLKINSSQVATQNIQASATLDVSKHLDTSVYNHCKFTNDEVTLSLVDANYFYDADGARLDSFCNIKLNKGQRLSFDPEKTQYANLYCNNESESYDGDQRIQITKIPIVNQDKYYGETSTTNE